MGSATPEAVGIVADTLKQRAGAVVAPRESVEVVGGIQPLVDIINRSDVSTEKAVLDGLERRDPELAEEVRSRMLTFEDIVKLESRDIQQVLRGIDPTVLAVAMKGAAEPVVEIIRANVSERNRELLDDEIRALGPVRMSQVEEARAEVVRAIRELEAQGVITVHRAEEDESRRVTPRSRPSPFPVLAERRSSTRAAASARVTRIRRRVRRRPAGARAAEQADALRGGSTPSARRSSERGRQRRRASSSSCAAVGRRRAARVHRARGRRCRGGARGGGLRAWPKRSSAYALGDRLGRRAGRGRAACSATRIASAGVERRPARTRRDLRLPASARSSHSTRRSGSSPTRRSPPATRSANCPTAWLDARIRTALDRAHGRYCS